MEELIEKKKMEEYREKMEKGKKLKERLEEIERKKVRECQQALEREKISKGMQCTKEDEITLRKMQNMQVQERHMIASEEKERDRMWHQVLLNQVRNKEHQEYLDFQRRQQEMEDRRRAYDEQIASANRKRREMIRMERERENRRVENIRLKMEMDREEEIKRKKEQQLLNSKNFIQGHEMKLSRLQSERQTDRQIDNQTIQNALEELRREKQREYLTMKKLQHEKRIFIQNYNKERQSAIVMNEETDQAARAWQVVLNAKAEEHLKMEKERRVLEKEKESSAYKHHLEELKLNSQKLIDDRAKRTERVRQIATNELRLQLRKSCDEFDKQMEYKNDLRRQIEKNQQVLSSELRVAEKQQRPFTRKPEMFSEAMKLKVDKSPGRNSTNPVHPFKRVLDMEISGTN